MGYNSEEFTKTMANLQDLINLAKLDGGKFFVMDEQGEVKLVIMKLEEYEQLLKTRLATVTEDLEKVNREIINAQLHEVSSETPAGKPVRQVPRVDLREEVIDPTFDFEGPKVELEEI